MSEVKQFGFWGTCAVMVLLAVFSAGAAGRRRDCGIRNAGMRNGVFRTDPSSPNPQRPKGSRIRNRQAERLRCGSAEARERGVGRWPRGLTPAVPLQPGP